MTGLESASHSFSNTEQQNLSTLRVSCPGSGHYTVEPSSAITTYMYYKLQSHEWAIRFYEEN